jgi:hypothetical protein
MTKGYLNISSAQDFSGAKERFIYRCLEALPAFLSWGTLVFVFILSWLSPVVAAIFVITFACLWLLRVLYLASHQLMGYRAMKKNLSIDWLEKIKKLKDWQNVYHLVILPMYKEEAGIVRPSLKSLSESKYPKDKMIVVLAVEERGGEKALATARIMEKEFAQDFFRFIVVVHPKDIVGEVAGKGSNVNWAIKKIKGSVVDQLAIPIENIVVSNFDVDTKPYPYYFAVLTWHYLTVENPLRSSFQPIPVYNNNIWQAPAFSRVIATSGTFWQMMQQERPEQLVTYSSHSMPLKTLLEVGYPSNVVSDDSRIFWKSYLSFDGDYRAVPLYYPVSMDAVLAETLSKTAINQYKQQRRWAWGCENIPYLFYGFLKNKKIPWREKFRHSAIILDGFWSWAVAALLLFFLGWLPLMVGGDEFKTSLLSYNLPRTTSFIMTIAMIGMIVSATLSLLLLPPDKNKNGRLSVVLQWLLLPLTLIIFGAFPALESQSRLAWGNRLGFWVTEKIRK